MFIAAIAAMAVYAGSQTAFVYLTKLVTDQSFVARDMDFIRWVPLLVENGQNPMLAYVGMMNLLYPVLGLTGIHTLLVGVTGDPWMGFLRALGYTLLLAWLVALATRRRWLWKT
jgi:hypothetical protein